MDKYEETINWLYDQLPAFSVIGPGAYKPGLRTAHMLDDAFDNPHHRFKSIHVAGTNGKGSTTHSIASILMAAGYKVGIYTSPHLVDFRERIRVDGEKIDKDFVVDFVDRYRAKALDCSPSFFELTTIMAFDYFAKSNVDYAVIEVGLGGRLDTTNIIKPELSVITNVSLDHTALLGNTIEEIAAEKAGIMKEGVPVVIGEAEGAVRDVFTRIANATGAPITFAQDHPIEYEVYNGRYRYRLCPEEGACDAKYDIESDLVGDYQVKNANTVLSAIHILGLVDIEAIKQGMSHVQTHTGLMGRWMQIGEHPMVVCDTGHNIGAWEYLAKSLTEISQKQKTTIVLGFANDKDVESIFKLLPKKAAYIFVQPQVKRARRSEELLKLAHENGLSGMCAETVTEGYRMALSQSGPADFVFVGGSNFVVAEIL